MKGKKVIFLNSGISLFSQIITIVFQFVIRSLFIRHIGIELLGLNGTFTSILSTLSLAELGFQTAVVYNLYKPLATNNKNEVNDILNVLKIVYRVIGILFICASIVSIPFLKYIIKGIEIEGKTTLYFLAQASTVACSYFLAYRRVLLYADQKNYIEKSIDLAFSIIFDIIQCITIICYKNYLVYIIVKAVQNILSNVVIHFYCSKYYDYLQKRKINKDVFKRIWSSVKNVFAGKIAGYIYQSTDNIIISSFVSTVSVGYLTNYTTITSSLKNIAGAILTPMVPVIGNFLANNESSNEREGTFLYYTHVRFLLAVIIVIPTSILINSFITIWIGKDMLIDNSIILLICLDLYIHLVHSATCDFINSSGLFKQDKKIEIIGAICNLVSSIILVQFLGIVGVLLGTVISQMVLWIGRTSIVYRHCFNSGKKSIIKYILRNLAYFVFVVILYVIFSFFYNFLIIQNHIIRFVVAGVIMEMLILCSFLIVFGYMNETRKLLQFIKK